MCPGTLADGAEESQNQAVGLIQDSIVLIFIIGVYFACQFYILLKIYSIFKLDLFPPLFFIFFVYKLERVN